jgi:phage terminase small subunit
MAMPRRDMARDMEAEMTDEQPKKLNKAQEVFISEYLQCFNATEAYSRAYPKAKRDSARAAGAVLLANLSISEAIQARLAEVHMGADEALKLTADIARGDVTEFITSFGALDIDALRKSGKGRLIKKIKQRTITKIGKNETDGDTEVHDTEIEFYDAQAAQRDILKVHGRFTEKVDVTSGGEKVNPYMNMDAAQLVALAEKIANAKHSEE